MIYMPFLYFPEDKSEYIPATILLIIFMVFAAVALYFVIKKSKKDEQNFEAKYKDRIQKIDDESKSKS